MATVLLIGPEDCRDIFPLPHPRTGQLSQFLQDGQGHLHEIISLSGQDKHSVFLPDEILANPSMYMATPFDEVFLLIAALRNHKSRTNYVEVDEILELFPNKTRTLMEARLPAICTALEEVSDYWKVDEDRIGALLLAKVDRIAKNLPASIVDKLPNDESVANLARSRAALQIVSSYLPAELFSVLSTKFDFSPLTAYLAERSLAEVFNPNEFIKRRPDGDGDEKIGLKKARKGSKGVEQLKKVNTKGMKSMTSFFAKKT